MVHLLTLISAAFVMLSVAGCVGDSRVVPHDAPKRLKSHIDHALEANKDGFTYTWQETDATAFDAKEVAKWQKRHLKFGADYAYDVEKVGTTNVVDGAEVDTTYNARVILEPTGAYYELCSSKEEAQGCTAPYVFLSPRDRYNRFAVELVYEYDIYNTHNWCLIFVRRWIGGEIPPPEKEWLTRTFGMSD